MTALGNRLDHAFTWSYYDPNRTVTTKTPTLKTTTAVASTRGLPSSVKEPSNQTTTFDTYDAEGRLLTKTDDVGTTTYTYWPNGLLHTVAETTGEAPNQVTRTTTRTYNELNRLESYQDGEGNTLSYTYYPAGELKTITYPGNKTVTYTYDDFGRLHTVTDWATPARTTTYTYDNASRLERIARANGTRREQFYDAASQLRFVKEYKSDNTLITFQELKYDDDGRVTTSFIHPKPPTVILPADSLAYDIDNQLSTWNSQGISFDADGNMTHGPLPSGTLDDYDYDSRNRLTSAGGSQYRYNPDGLRVAITSDISNPQNFDPISFVIDPNAALSRTLMRTQNGTTTYYVYGLGLLYEETNGSTKTYHSDQVGSTLALTDDSQTVTDRWSYTPYGAVTQMAGSTGTPFLYNGELGVQTDHNGLLHMRARYYNPRLMRFLNADPIGFEGGLNWYASFDNNPVGKADPLGLTGWAMPAQLNQNAGFTAGYWQGAANAVPMGLGAAGAAFTGPIVGGAILSAGINTSAQLNSGSGFSKTSLAIDTAVGAAAPLALGKAVPYVASKLSNAAKGSVGEWLSYIKGVLTGKGVNPAEGETIRVAGRQPKPDFAYPGKGPDGNTLYVEAKFGTSSLTGAQRAAANALGDNWITEYWTYEWMEAVAGAAGQAAGAANAASQGGGNGRK
jgi:RHS repeat-associated protein